MSTATKKTHQDKDADLHNTLDFFGECVYQDLNGYMAFGVKGDRGRQECDPHHTSQLEFFLPGKRGAEAVTRQDTGKGTQDQGGQNDRGQDRLHLYQTIK